jgi:hypothetical protein
VNPITLRQKQRGPTLAASMLNTAWHMLKDRVEYKDLGADHFAPRSLQGDPAPAPTTG